MMLSITQSALITLAFLAGAARQSDAFGVSCTRTLSTTRFRSSVQKSTPASFVGLRAEDKAEATGDAGDDVEASAKGGEEEDESAAPEEVEPEEDPEVVAIKESIADLEAKIKAKRNDLASLIDLVETYSKAGYARKVAEMDQIRKMRGAASKSNEFTAKATILQDFLPVLDELVALDDKYADDDFAKSYKALRWDLNNAMTALGMSEYAPEVGAVADASRFIAVEEHYSDDFAKGTIIAPVSVGLELQGNVMKMAECVVSLGSEAEAEAKAKEAAEAEDAKDDNTADE